MSAKQNHVLLCDFRLFRMIRQKHVLGFEVPIYLRHVDLLMAEDNETFEEKYVVMCNSCHTMDEFSELEQTFEKYKEYVNSRAQDVIIQHIIANGFDRYLEYKVKNKELQLVTISAERYDRDDELSVVHQFNDIVDYILSFESNVYRIETTISNDQYVATISRELIDPDFVIDIGHTCYRENNEYKDYTNYLHESIMLHNSIYLGDSDIDYEFDSDCDYSDGD